MTKSEAIDDNINAIRENKVAAVRLRQMRVILFLYPYTDITANITECL